MASTALLGTPLDGQPPDAQVARVPAAAPRDDVWRAGYIHGYPAEVNFMPHDGARTRSVRDEMPAAASSFDCSLYPRDFPRCGES